MSRFNKYLFWKTQNTPLYLQNIIKPLYIVTKLFGLFPYSVAFNKTRQSFVLTSKSIYINSLGAVTVCLVILAFFGLHIQELILGSENDNMVEAIMTEINYVLELVMLIMFCIVAYFCAFLNRTKYVKMFNQITSTWYELPPNVNTKQILTNLQFQVNVVCFGSLFVTFVIQFIVNYTRESGLWKMILVTITFNLPQTIQFVTLAFFYIMVRIVDALLMSINWHCHQLLRHHTNAIDGFVQVQSTPALTLRQMELIYVRAFEIKTKINEAFQGPILATALQSFHSMVSKIGQTLHKISTENLDARWLMEIQHFSTLMYHQNIELTVYDYFPLNATLIYNTMAAASMYLIILVQFDKRD